MYSYKDDTLCPDSDFICPQAEGGPIGALAGH